MNFDTHFTILLISPGVYPGQRGTGQTNQSVIDD